jgi:hypothetical protein
VEVSQIKRPADNNGGGGGDGGGNDNANDDGHDVASAYSGDVNGRFQRDVNRHSGDVNKVGRKPADSPQAAGGCFSPKGRRLHVEEFDSEWSDE